MAMSKPHVQSGFKRSHLLILVAAIIGLLLLLLWPHRLAGVSQVSLGQCLKEHGVQMFGSDTCTNCLDQKNIFGADFHNVDYVNCDFQKQLCEKKGIRYYPVWYRGDKTLVGVQSLQKLGEFGQCEKELLIIND